MQKYIFKTYTEYFVESKINYHPNKIAWNFQQIVFFQRFANNVQIFGVKQMLQKQSKISHLWFLNVMERISLTFLQNSISDTHNIIRIFWLHERRSWVRILAREKRHKTKIVLWFENTFSNARIRTQDLGKDTMCFQIQHPNPLPDFCCAGGIIENTLPLQGRTCRKSKSYEPWKLCYWTSCDVSHHSIYKYDSTLAFLLSALMCHKTKTLNTPAAV